MKARENVFALQSKKLHAADEKEKDNLQKKHLDDIAPLKADSSTYTASKPTMRP